jgi:hypothetical protein
VPLTIRYVVLISVCLCLGVVKAKANSSPAGVEANGGSELVAAARAREHATESYMTSSSSVSKTGVKLTIIKYVLNKPDGTRLTRTEYHSTKAVSPKKTKTDDRVFIRNGDGEWVVIGPVAIKTPSRGKSVEKDAVSVQEDVEPKNTHYIRLYSVTKGVWNGHDCVEVTQDLPEDEISNREKMARAFIEKRYGTSLTNFDVKGFVPRSTTYDIDPQSGFIVRERQISIKGTTIDATSIDSITIGIDNINALVELPKGATLLFPKSEDENKDLITKYSADAGKEIKNKP